MGQCVCAEHDVRPWLADVGEDLRSAGDRGRHDLIPIYATTPRARPLFAWGKFNQCTTPSRKVSGCSWPGWQSAPEKPGASSRYPSHHKARSSLGTPAWDLNEAKQMRR